MSVRNAIIVACIAFLAVVSSLALFVRSQERELSGLAADLYDQAFVGLNYAHKAHTGWVRLETAHRAEGLKSLNEEERAELDDILDNMDVAIERAITEKSREKAKAVRAEIAAIEAETAGAAALSNLAEIEKDLTKLVQRYAADGLELRSQVDEVVANLTRIILAGIAVTLVLSFLIWFVVVKVEFTERRRSEQLLRASEERFRVIFEKAPVGIGLVTPDGRFISVNPRLTDMLGYSAAELVQLRHTDVTHPDDVEVSRANLARLFRRECDSYSIEKRYRRKDGSIIWGLLTVSSVFDEAGGPRNTIGVVEDITAQKEISEALKRSEAGLAEAQRIAHLGSWEHDLVASKLVWSDEMYRIFGIDRRRFGPTYEEFLARVHPDDRAAVKEASAPAVQAREPQSVQYRILRPDGEERIVHSRRVAYFDDNERAVRLAGTVQDVTERVMAEEALQQSEERLRQVIRVSDIGIFDHDHRTESIYWSPEQRKIYGWSRDEPVSLQRFFDHVYPDDVERITAAVRRAHDPAGDGIFDVEHRILRRDGKVRWLTTRARTFFEGEGGERRPVRTVGGVLDITERKRAEEQLQQAQKIETTGRLAGGIAHDFNNLLMIIQGNLELLREELAGQSRFEGVADRALHATARSAELVSQLLAFSRRQSLQPQAVDVGALVGRMKNLLDSMIMETISVRISVPDDLWHAFVDPAQLENALLNLALNARDAMPKGGTLSIEAANTQLTPDRFPAGSEIAPGTFVRIRVVDTGTGMPPEVLKQAFEPFFTTKEVGRGSGLGLSMVYGFVKQSGGHIEIDSVPGRGTRVDLYLRRTSPKRAAEAPTDEAGVRAGGETILVVEDNPDVRDVAVAFLRKFGYRLIEAPDGPAALAILESNQPVNLLFTDIVMPGGMSGIELARKALELKPGIKLLFATGHAEAAAANDTAPETGGEVLAKPYRIRDLARAVRDALKTPACH